MNTLHMSQIPKKCYRTRFNLNRKTVRDQEVQPWLAMLTSEGVLRTTLEEAWMKPDMEEFESSPSPIKMTSSEWLRQYPVLGQEISGSPGGSGKDY